MNQTAPQSQPLERADLLQGPMSSVRVATESHPTLPIQSIRPLTRALQSFFKPTTFAGSLDYYIQKRQAEAAILSILASAFRLYKDSRTPRRFPLLVGVGGTRCQTSNPADEIDEFSSYSDADCERDDETVEASRRREAVGHIGTAYGTHAMKN